MSIEINIPGYQTLAAETNRDGTAFIYIGDNYVALTREQAKEFARALLPAPAQGSAVPGRADLADLPGNVDIINHIRDLKSIEDVHAYVDGLLASRFEDQDGDQEPDSGSAAAEKLLHEARELFHGPTFPPGFRAASDAYEAALAAIPQIPERQRKNVYEQSMYAATYGRIPLAERIDAAIGREATRTVRIAEKGLRVETVESWVRKIVDGEIVTTVDVEVYDAETGGLWTNRESVRPEFVERATVDLYVQIVTAKESESEPKFITTYE